MSDFDENVNEKPKDDNIFRLPDDILWLTHEMEFQHQPKEIQFRSNDNSALKFGTVINRLFDIRKEELSVLTVNDGDIRIIKGEDEIWNYEFLDHYKRDEKGDYSYWRKGCSALVNQSVLSLAYRTYDKSDGDKDKSISKESAMLIVHLQYPLGHKQKVMYIQATFCRPTVRFERGKKIINGVEPPPECFSVLFAIDYRENNEEIFFDAYNSALDKLNENRTEELNPLEMDLLRVMMHPDIAQQFYMGKSVLAERRFWDAIVYFENAFNAMQKKVLGDMDESKPEDYEFLPECSYWIGFCYYELGLFVKAYKYLEFSYRSFGEGYKYIMEYINCLISLEDIRTLSVVDDCLDYINKKSLEDRTPEAAQYDHYFMLFLLRRKAFFLIEMKKYDAAIEYLDKLLEYDPGNSFAVSELAYIEQTIQNLRTEDRSQKTESDASDES